MNESLVESVRSLLEQAKKVHIDFERDVLGGAYDKEWPIWYAMYLLENGLARVLVPGNEASLDAKRLADLLAQADEMHRANEPDSDWMVYYARYLIEVTSGKG